MGMELRYCPTHERLYDAIAHQWIPFLRGEVCLVRAIYPREDDLSFWEDVCDWCVSVDQRRCVSPCEAQWPCCAPCLCQLTRHERGCSTPGGMCHYEAIRKPVSTVVHILSSIFA